MAEKKSAEVKEISIGKKLKALYDLQSIMSEIDQLRSLRGELPGEVKDLEDEIEGLQTRVQKFVTNIKEIEEDICKRNESITESAALIDRYTKQIENVRNNREFDNLSKEVEFQGLEVELAHKHIREFKLAIEQKKEEQGKAEGVLQEKNDLLAEKKEELNNIVVETKQDEEKLIASAEKIEAIIEPRLLEAFKRIRGNARNGLSIVTVERDACGGCFNKIPPQRQLDIHLHKTIIICEYCGRILIDPELAGITEKEA